jgi:site-specific recombinase XerD
MQNSATTKKRARQLAKDLAVIDGAFTAHLRSRHSSAFVVRYYSGFLHDVAHFLSERGRSLSTLRREDVPMVIEGCLPGWKALSCRPRKSALNRWLKFNGRFLPASPPSRWQPWIDDYAQFLDRDRGLTPDARDAYCRVAGRYLAWQFYRRRVDWRSVVPQDIWRYASELQDAGRKPKGVSDELSALRQFLRFVHLRGSCPAMLSQAVPTITERPRTLIRPVLTEEQRRQLLASFDRKTAEGRRDYTMALCMTDLGLRGIEVVRLRLDDIDWERTAISVPPAKNGSGRRLPLPPHVTKALGTYVHGRPPTDSDRLFVGHAELIGRPVSPCALRAAIDRAYRRCGFPWHGTHRLRRCFATRLYARGANMKEIADLLGHRLVTTTERYAQVDRDGLRALVRPWPL